jgi:hypothetical protein
MLPALIAGIGLPLLTKLVGAGLEKIDSPVAKSAAEALGQVGDALVDGDIRPEEVQEANRHLETIARIEAERDQVVLSQINATMREETRSEDAYVRRWRPTFGYAVAVTWAVQTGGLTYAVVATPQYAGEILAALSNLSIIWGVALSVLGVNVVKRSQDKAVAAGQAPRAGALAKLAELVAGGRGGG